MQQMKDSGVSWLGEIPNNWFVSKLKFYIKQNDGGLWGNDPVENEKNSIVLRSTEQTIDGKWLIEDPAERYLGNELLLEYYKIKKDDLLITKSSGSHMHIGKTTLVTEKEANKDYFYSNFLQRIHTNSLLNSKYLWYFLNNPCSREQFVYMQNSTSGIGNINSENIENLKVSIPSLQQQSKVADFLDKKCEEIDSLISNIQKEIEILQDYKKSVITESVMKGLNKNVKLKYSGIEWAKQIPEHWEISKISNVYKLRNQKVSDIDFDPLSVTMKGIFPQWESVAKSDAHDDRKLVRKGDFVINSRSDRRGSCGISDRDGSVSLINHVLQPLANMDSNYYSWLFHTESFADEFYKWGHGIVNDLWTTNWKDMKRILIPQPPIQEQKKIAEYLDKKSKEIDSIIEDKNKQLETLVEYKKSIIYEYVTGKKEVK